MEGRKQGSYGEVKEGGKEWRIGGRKEEMKNGRKEERKKRKRGRKKGRKGRKEGSSTQQVLPQEIPLRKPCKKNIENCRLFVMGVIR